MALHQEATNLLPVYRHTGKYTDIEAPVEQDLTPQTPPLTSKQWLQILSAFVVFLNTWGLLLAFGAFQTYYQETLLKNHTPSSLAWISTVSAFILLFSGLVTGPLFDYGFLRPLLFFGSLLEIFGLMMLSVSTEYYQVFPSQGICVGLGGGMIFIPSIAAAAFSLQEFRRAKFISIISSATGGVIYPIVFRRLVFSAGFPWSIRCIAFIVFATFLLSWPILMYPPNKSPIVRNWIDISALTDMAFVSTVFGTVLSAMAYYLPMLYLPLFAETAIEGFHNIDLAFYLVSIANGTSVIGRLLAGLVATKIGPIETCSLAVITSALLLYCWLALKSTGGLIVWAAFWGLISSAIVAMPGAIVPLLSPSLGVIGTRTGMLWAGVGVGMLIGSPIAGALVDETSGKIHWWHAQLFAALCMTFSSFFFVYPTIYVRRKKAGGSA
ncbi:hypothetical protein OIDMADRAFT_137595 [Oidiodendron maius Zn]|uniref:Major facilitator superfamily (MFS) profile domain-containing protein n=1 Tax=Oidiodendron maius (strain Zn) TaxID=913774 RepID=A0A0C3GBJ3_OIDMZ|nr:hypothetical protein OIDMADRAFT_137595 [Oidiodendron maius Zn]